MIINTSAPIMKTNVGEQVLDLVIPYIHNVDDRNSVSFVSHKFYQIDAITRKSVTVQAYYSPNPASISKRFPFIESLTLKGPPTMFYSNTDGYDIPTTPWIQQLALEFRSLKELHISNLDVLDKDLETLAITRGKDLRSFKITNCEGYTTRGLRHVSKYCNQLRTLCVGHFDYYNLNDGSFLHELALNSKVLEIFKYKNMDIDHADVEDLTLLAKNCCNSLISLKIGKCYLSKLRDVFRYAVRLEHFEGYIRHEETGLVGFRFPPNTRSLSVTDLPDSIRLPFLNHIRKLKLEFWVLEAECGCLLFKQCPNLEVLYTEDVCGDAGLQVIGKFCKKLRKLTYCGRVTHVGLIALVKGCTNLESLDVVIEDISNEALECVGTHLKNLRHFRICVGNENNLRDLPLDNGIQAMLIGCSKLERLRIIDLWHGGLTDVGLEYIGKYGVNLRSLALECERNSNIRLTKLSDAGLVKLSEGCPRLRELELTNCGFSEEVATRFMFNTPSLRYVGIYDDPGLAYMWHNVTASKTESVHFDNLKFTGNGIRAMLMGCNKLESIYINIWLGGLTDVGLKYIGKYGANLRSLSLTGTGESNVGLVKLWGFPSSKQVASSSVFNIQSLRYVWSLSADNIVLAPTRPEFQL